LPDITVRYFAAAEAAAGTGQHVLTIEPGTTVAEVIGQLGSDGALRDVLRRCSYLCDGIAVRDDQAPLQNGQTLDILPPFAGG